jgi:lipoprotein-releasing system ATP-binding protein
MAGRVVLEASGVGRVYRGTGTDIEVLRGVDLSVAEGQVACIIGASGVGKSTLLHILGSLDRPDSGSVTIHGQNVHALEGRALDQLRSRTIGFVFQFHFLLPDFTALENVMMPQLIARKSVGDASKAATRWLERVGLGHRLSHRPGELSGGEQQRVAIARALVNGPAVVFADEPTGNLDDDNARAVLDLFTRLLRPTRKTLLLVTHSALAAALGDRVLELREGRTLERSAAT